MILRQFLHTDPVAINLLPVRLRRARRLRRSRPVDIEPYQRVADETGMRIRFVGPDSPAQLQLCQRSGARRKASAFPTALGRLIV